MEESKRYDFEIINDAQIIDAVQKLECIIQFLREACIRDSVEEPLKM